MPTPEAERNFGKYRLLDRIATGGMAEIYRAKYQAVAGVTKPVVIKKILPAFAGNKSFVSMFINEAKIVVGLSHGNIAQVFDFGEIDGEYFLAMEYVHGQPLSKVLKKAKEVGIPVLPAPHACLVAIELCKGLHHAHTRRDERGAPLQIIHRDVSPQNVLLSFEGHVKIVDFGIAKARTATHVDTQPGAVKGKYVYFAPEQALGKALDARTDVFAAGVVLYEMLCGRLPFEGRMIDVMGRIVRGDFDRPRAVNATIPAALEKIVLTAMATDPAARYQSAQALGDALAGFLYSQAPTFSNASVAHLIGYLFEDQLRAEGVPLHLPPDFVAELDGWRSAKVARAAAEEPTLSDKPRAMARQQTQRGPTERLAPRAAPAAAEPPPHAVIGDDEDTLSPDAPTALAPRSAPPTAVIPVPPPAPSWGLPRWVFFTVPAMAMLVAALAVVLIGARDARIELTSEPAGALVLVDGQPTSARTPVVISGLSPGEPHTVEVRATGMQPWRRELTLQPGAVEAVHAQLSPATSP